MVRAAVAQEGVDAAVLTGLAGGRAKISLERVAINVQDARMPDNDGDCPVDLPIRAEGPGGLFCYAAPPLHPGGPARCGHPGGNFQ